MPFFLSAVIGMSFHEMGFHVDIIANGGWRVQGRGECPCRWWFPCISERRETDVREALIKSLSDFILALDKNSYEIRFCE